MLSDPPQLGSKSFTELFGALKNKYGLAREYHAQVEGQVEIFEKLLESRLCSHTT